MSGHGETDLNRLLATMEPTLLEETYIFCSMPDTALFCCFHLDPLAVFREKEGLSLVLTEAKAQSSGISNQSSPYKCITLTVHSSLEAVGLTAAVAKELADCGISANVVAAFYHDHIFVPAGRATEAVEALHRLQQRAQQATL